MGVKLYENLRYKPKCDVLNFFPILQELEKI